MHHADTDQNTCRAADSITCSTEQLVTWCGYKCSSDAFFSGSYLSGMFQFKKCICLWCLCHATEWQYMLTCGLVLFLHNLRNLQMRMSPTWHVTSCLLMKYSCGELAVIQEEFADRWRCVLFYWWKVGWRVPTCCFLVDINIWCKIPGLYE